MKKLKNMKKLIAAILSSLILASPAAATSLLHYSFSPGSYYNYSPTPNTPVTGSFDFDTSTGILSNVDYTSISGHFTTGAEYSPGVATQVYFGDINSPNYDVYQLANSLTNGGTVQINSGTHPSIVIYAAGSLTTGATSAVPEPASWAMMLVGFCVIGFAMRQRSIVRPTVSFA